MGNKYQQGTPKPDKNVSWEREGYFYVYRRSWSYGGVTFTSIKRLGFITYHLIRWIHGDEKLIEMGRA